MARPLRKVGTVKWRRTTAFERTTKVGPSRWVHEDFTVQVAELLEVARAMRDAPDDITLGAWAHALSAVTDPFERPVDESER
jgi:hypothetical protein